MKKSLFFINTKFNFGEITEFEVVKETEKTYTVETSRVGKYTVRKSEMRRWNGIFCESRADALLKRQELLEERIESCKTKIENLKQEIEKMTTQLSTYKTEWKEGGKE